LLNDYLRLLRQQFQSFTKTFVIVDALDESKEQDNTRQTLVEALKTIKSDVHLLVTSRWIPSIENEFRDALKLEIRASDENVANYVQLRIATTERLQRHVRADPILENVITAKVAQNCHGM